MLNLQYEKCQKAKLIDLVSMPLEQIQPWLSSKPEWMQKQIYKAIKERENK